MSKRIQNYILSACVLSLVLLGQSCTKFDDPAPIFEDGESTIKTNARRILLINIDGAVGQQVQQLMPTNIASLLPNSKYTFTGMSEINSSYGTTWASISSGVGMGKHKITTNSFEVGNDDTHAAPPFFPSFFYKVMELKPYYATTAILRDSTLSQKLFNEADSTFIQTTDAAIAEKAVERLTNAKDVVSLVQFSSVQEAGQQAGFTLDNPSYKTALETVDSYVGKMLQAVKDRPSYKDEEWLIIVQSNNGGKGTVMGGTSWEERNIFAIYYNPKFKQLEFAPHIMEGTRFFRNENANNFNGAKASNTTAYDFTAAEMSIEFFIKANNVYTSNSNVFMLGKSSGNNQNANPRDGWFIYHRSQALAFYGMMTDGTSLTTTDGLPALKKDVYNHVVITLKKNGGTINRSIYTDGLLTKSDDIVLKDASATISSSTEFEIRARNSHNTSIPQYLDFDLSNLRIWNKALSAEEIAANYCAVTVPAEALNYAHITAYYPLNTDLKNIIPNAPDLVSSGTVNVFNLQSGNIVTSCDNPATSMLLSNVSSAANMYYWLNFDFKTFGLDATSFLNLYELEFIEQH